MSQGGGADRGSDGEGGESKTGGGEDIDGPAEATVGPGGFWCLLGLTEPGAALKGLSVSFRMERIKSRQQKFRRGKEKMLSLKQDSFHTDGL